MDSEGEAHGAEAVRSVCSFTTADEAPGATGEPVEDTTCRFARRRSSGEPPRVPKSSSLPAHPLPHRQGEETEEERAEDHGDDLHDFAPQIRRHHVARGT